MPLPAGYTLDSAPKLPAGYTLDKPPLTTMDDLAAQKGPVRRFVESAAQTLNPVPLAKKLLTAETYTEPFTTMAKVPDDLRKGNYLDAIEHGTRLAQMPGPPIPGDTIANQIHKLREQHAALKRGDIGEAFSRGVGALPGGGVAEGVIDQARSGDVAGAAGTVTGLVLGPKAVRGVAGLPGRLAPSLERGAQSSAIAAAEATPKGQGIAIRAGKSAPLANSDGVVNLKGQSAKVPQTPGRIIANGVGRAAVGQIVRATGIPFAGELAAGASAMKTIAQLAKTPAWLKASASIQSRVAELLKAGKYAEGAEVMSRAVGLSNASQDPRQRYIDHLMGSGLDSKGRDDVQLNATGHEFSPSPQREQLLSGSDGKARRLPLLLPDGFLNANKVAELPPNTRMMAEEGATGMFGGRPDPSARSGLSLNPNDLANTVSLAKGYENDIPTRQHEVSHAVWFQDLNEGQRQAFRDHIKTVTDAFSADLSRDPNLLNEARKQASDKSGSAWTLPYSHAIIRPYLAFDLLSQKGSRPESVAREAFAEMLGQFLSNPEGLRSAHPRDYEMIRSVWASGFRQP